MSEEELAKKVQDFAAQLAEHCDAVQIFVSKTEEGICRAIYRGAGNWYARQGMAHEFINQDVAQENAKQLGDKINDRPDGEDWKE